LYIITENRKNAVGILRKIANEKASESEAFCGIGGNRTPVRRCDH